MTLGEMEVPVAWLGRVVKALSSPSPSCFGSWPCYSGEWWSGVRWSWGEVFSDTPRVACSELDDWGGELESFPGVLTARVVPPVQPCGSDYAHTLWEASICE